MEQTAETRPLYNHGVITEKNKASWLIRQRKCMVPLIRQRLRIHDEESGVPIPSYIQRLFDYFCDCKRTLNVSCILSELQFMDQSLAKILFKELDDDEPALNVDILMAIFPNVESYVNEHGEETKISNK